MHALARIAERAPGCDPDAIFYAIRAADRDGTLQVVAATVTGERVALWAAPNGIDIFPVIAADGGIITVLAAGMEVSTPTGRIKLGTDAEAVFEDMAAPAVSVEPDAPAAPTFAPLGPGVYPDIDDDRYHADLLCDVPTLSSGVARKLIFNSPLHGWAAHQRLNPDYERKDTATFDMGHAIHRAILGKGTDYVPIPAHLLSSNGAAGTAAAKAWIADARDRGLTPLKADVVAQINAIASSAIEKFGEMGITFDPARSEMTAIAEIDGAMCRARIDNAPLDPRLPLRDLKSCEDASPAACIRAVERYGLDVQCAHYLDTWEAATRERRKFDFCFVEKTAPYEVCVVRLHDSPNDSADWMLDARSKIGEARRVWVECRAANHWPGYTRRVAVIGARSFHRQAWADREVGVPVIPKKPATETLAAAASWQAPKGATA